MERLKRLAPLLRYAALTSINTILGYVEPWLTPNTFSPGHRPVFIIGAPRSGSTLFYQVLVNRFDFGYLTNFHCSCYGFPYLLQSVLGRWIPKPTTSDYESTHGFVQGRWAPSECGRFWYRWFRRNPQYVPIEAVNLDELQSLRRVVAGLARAFGQPILFKNMPCALRLRPLAAVLPEAVFLVIRREILHNAQSLLLTRQHIHGDISKWWSMEPPNIEELCSLEPEAQVVKQIHSIYDLIDRDAEVIGKHRFLAVQYEEFCRDVYEVTNCVRDFLSRHGIKVKIRGEVPASFNASREIELDQRTIHRLQEAIDGTL
jgi:hypothetical protein